MVMPMPKGFRERPGFAPALTLEVGQEIVGEILSYKMVELEERDRGGGIRTRLQPLIQIQKADGNRVTFWLGSNVEERVSKEDIGKQVWIERLPDTAIDGRPSPMKTYNVAVAE